MWDPGLGLVFMALVSTGGGSSVAMRLQKFKGFRVGGVTCCVCSFPDL